MTADTVEPVLHLRSWVINRLFIVYRTPEEVRPVKVKRGPTYPTASAICVDLELRLLDDLVNNTLEANEDECLSTH